MSAVFSSVVTDFWRAWFSGTDVGTGHTSFVVTVNAGLRADRRLMLLSPRDDDPVRAVLTPDIASAIGLADRSTGAESLTERDFRAALTAAGITLHGMDFLFYFSDADLVALRQDRPSATVRRLSAADAAIFADFQAAVPEADLDAAWVELDHWAVFGAFADGRLVGAASMVLWENAPIADLGVVTRPEFRGRGHARAVVRALSGHAAEQGFQPQYRCQFDNHASAALATAAGFTQFGSWEVVSADATS